MPNKSIERIFTLKLFKRLGTPCLEQARTWKFNWEQRYSNPQ